MPSAALPSSVQPPTVTWAAAGAVTPAALRAMPCPNCGAADPKTHMLTVDVQLPDNPPKRLRLLRCPACTCRFYDDQVPPDYAEPALNDRGRVPFYVQQGAGVSLITRPLAMALAPPGSTYMEVGCGYGFGLDFACNTRGWRGRGIDPAPLAALGRDALGLPIELRYLRDDGEAQGTMDVVMGSEVIEHIPAPYSFIALLRRWMQPGATLVLTTPNADTLTPGQDPANLVCMLSVGAHVILYSARAIEVLLRRSGFAHIHTEAAGDTLVAFASDQPLRFDANAPARHLAGYRAYLQHLVATAEPGRPLWNGAAGRLFELQCIDAPDLDALALWDRIALAWRERFGIDLLRRRMPAPVREQEFGRDAMALLQAHAATQPFNLGAVLAARAVLERRLPGHTPDTVLSYARPAFSICVQARRVLEEAGLIDLALRNSAMQARMLMLDSLAELAPEVELELLAAFATGSGGALAGRIDVPPGQMLPRIAHPFIRAVEDGRKEEAARLAPALQDLDAVAAAPHSDPITIVRLFQAIGMVRLHLHDPTGARAAFVQMAAQAAGWNAHPDWAAQAGPLLALANVHISHMDGLAQ